MKEHDLFKVMGFLGMDHPDLPCCLMRLSMRIQNSFLTTLMGRKETAFIPVPETREDWMALEAVILEDLVRAQSATGASAAAAADGEVLFSDESVSRLLKTLTLEPLAVEPGEMDQAGSAVTDKDEDEPRDEVAERLRRMESIFAQSFEAKEEEPQPKVKIKTRGKAHKGGKGKKGKGAKAPASKKAKKPTPHPAQSDFKAAFQMLKQKARIKYRNFLGLMNGCLKRFNDDDLRAVVRGSHVTIHRPAARDTATFVIPHGGEDSIPSGIARGFLDNLFHVLTREAEGDV